MYEISKQERQTMEALDFPIAIYQRRSHFVKTLLVSDGFCDLFHLTREELIRDLDESMFLYVHPDDKGKLYENAQKFWRHESFYKSMFRVKIPGSDDYHIFLCEGSLQKISEEEEIAYVVYTDMNSVEKDMQEADQRYFIEEEDYYYIDRLTKLPNEHYFELFGEEYLAAFKRRRAVVGIAYINIMRMTGYNDRYGFKAGDLLLQDLADILRDFFPHGLVIKGMRDHFMVLDRYETLQEKVEQVQKRLNTYSLNGNQALHIGISLPLEGNKSHLKGAVNEASYASKYHQEDSRTIVQYFTMEMKKQYFDRLYILETFEKALSNKWIKVFYQPIVNSQTRQVHAFEALARWHDPDYNMLSPAAFIPVLEEHHLIHRLDMYMVQTVFEEIKLRRDAHLPIVPVSVNFCVDDFEDGHLKEKLLHLCEKYDAQPWMIVIEITERDIPQMPEPFKEQIEALRQAGFKVWVDDFGSGYSSLNVLNKFPHDLIKIDREFIKDYGHDDQMNTLVVEKIIEVAKQLGIQTLVEGVETAAQHHFLKRIGCEYEQGFYFAQPASLSEMIFMQSHEDIEIPIEHYELS